MKAFILIVAILVPAMALGGTITEPTVNFCNIEADQDAPTPKPGWNTFAYCRDGELVMVVPTKEHGPTKFIEVKLGNHNYPKEVTGLPCNISVYKCDVESY